MVVLPLLQHVQRNKYQLLRFIHRSVASSSFRSERCKTGEQPIPAESLPTVISSFPRSHLNCVVCINQILTSVFQVRVQRAPSIMISLMDTPARASGQECDIG